MEIEVSVTTSSILRDQPRRVPYFQGRDLFCSFWDNFCRFIYIVRPIDHFCLGITFAAAQAARIVTDGLFLQSYFGYAAAVEEKRKISAKGVSCFDSFRQSRPKPSKCTSVYPK